MRLERVTLPLVGLFVGLTVANFTAPRDDAVPTATSESLLVTGETILDQPVAYPEQASALVTAAMVTLPPGAETALHHHDVPMFAYILEGEVTVKYEGAGTRVYRSGDALMEAINTPHDGVNTGTGPVRILTVFMGAVGIPNTVMSK